MDDDDVIILNTSLHKSDKIEDIKSKEKICDILKTKNSIECDSSDLEILKANYNNIYEEKNLETKSIKEKQCNNTNFYKLNVGKNNIIIENTKEKEWSDSDFPEVNFEYESSIKNNTRKEFQSDSDYESQNIPNDSWAQFMKILRAEHQVDIEVSSNNEELLRTNEKNNKKNEKKNVNKSSKMSYEEKKQQNKIEKQEEIARQKALKDLNSKNRLNINPEYSMKLMEIILDEEIKNYDFFIEFLKYFQENEIKYHIKSQLIPKCISWNRNIEDNYINQKNKVCTSVQTVNENHIIIIWSCEETVKHIFYNTFISAINNIKLLVPDKKLSLLIYKIESYFKYLRNMKNRTIQEEISGSTKKQKKNKTALDNNFSNYPKISRKKFEKSLVEVQLMYNVSSRLIENQTEMILWINQYSKSLALLPSKIINRLQSTKVDWYFNCDNRDTVKVDKDGNGLKRLWQQQLCQFTLMSLETSEAISSVYKSPLHLMEAYKNCNQAKGELLLKDISIRRAAGPLTSVRKIGPELSKKIFVMFTSVDGKVSLND